MEFALGAFVAVSVIEGVALCLLWLQHDARLRDLAKARQEFNELRADYIVGVMNGRIRHADRLLGKREPLAPDGHPSTPAASGDARKAHRGEHST